MKQAEDDLVNEDVSERVQVSVLLFQVTEEEPQRLLFGLKEPAE